MLKNFHSYLNFHISVVFHVSDDFLKFLIIFVKLGHVLSSNCHFQIELEVFSFGLLKSENVVSFLSDLFQESGDAERVRLGVENGLAFRF
jgi:hypothetical protein